MSTPKKTTKRQSYDATDTRPGTHGELEVEDMGLDEADEAILSSLQDIAEHLDDFDPESEGVTLSLREIDGDLPGVTSSPAPVANEADKKKKRRVHTIPDTELDESQDALVEELRRDLQKSTEEANQAQRSLNFLKTDFENYKRREQREREELAEKNRSKVILDLLPVYDSILRGLERMETLSGADGIEGFLEGYTLTRNLFEKVLRSHGVEAIPALDHLFNPRLHEAMKQVDRTDVAHNIVVAEYQRGFTMNGKTLRASVVVVAKNPGGVVPAPKPVEPPKQTEAETTTTATATTEPTLVESASTEATLVETAATTQADPDATVLEATPPRTGDAVESDGPVNPPETP